MSKTITVVSWNVNGIRAACRKGFLEWLEDFQPDILCLQETKAQVQDLSESIMKPLGYRSIFFDAERKGYSGTAIYLKEKPIEIKLGLQNKYLNEEGRIITVELNDYIVVNSYVPNGRGKERLNEKLRFLSYFLETLDGLSSRDKPIIVCTDFNVAHTENDLFDPKSNKNKTGYLTQERTYLDRIIEIGYVDVVRQFNPSAKIYTWWNPARSSRQLNKGWRFDYILISNSFVENVIYSEVNLDVSISDHAPVVTKISI